MIHSSEQRPAIEHDFPLKDHNSFGISQYASLYTAPANVDQLAFLAENYDFENSPYLVLGEGSNLLFTTDYKGIVLNPGIRGTELISEEEDEVIVRVGAAENWDQWVEYSIQQGWYGLENLSLIPGSVGSSPVQNIGAYGVELKDRIAWLEAWDLIRKVSLKMDPSQCHFGYRNSIFKTDSLNRLVITHVAFKLRKRPHLQLDYGKVREAFLKEGGSTPADLRKVIISIRKQKLPDPTVYGNAGSFFKNPVVDRITFNGMREVSPEISFHPQPENQVKVPAAWLIENAGWKGKRLGRVGTWPNQPLVIVNYGGATGQEILDFSEEIRKDVNHKFGIYLEREVNVIGDR
jgi:UDP-N-acetylmuramate dehydrogenase